MSGLRALSFGDAIKIIKIVVSSGPHHLASAGSKTTKKNKYTTETLRIARVASLKRFQGTASYGVM